MQERTGICWPQGGTVGRMTASSERIRGTFAGDAGSDAIVGCDLVDAGKYRNGAVRAWCRIHLHYWGVKADLAAFAATGLRQCGLHDQPLHYALDPLRLDPRDYHRVSIEACNDETFSLTTQARPVELSRHHGALPALLIACPPGLFHAPDITHLQLTAAALVAWHALRVSGKAIGCVDCARCGHPHLDLGAFADREHRRHTCGHCGNDSTHSTQAIVSHPLFALLNASEGSAIELVGAA